MWRAVSRNADVVLLAAACCFGTGLFIAWGANGFNWSSHQRHAAAKHVAVSSTPARAQPRPHPASRSRPKPKPRPQRSGVTLTLVAARGSAWVSLHAGSPAGRTLFQGLLAPRGKITFTGPRFAARFQASSNLVAVIGGRRADLGRYELRDVIITRAGIHLLAMTRRTGVPAVIAS